MDDNNRLVDEWFSQLGWSSLHERMRTAMSRIVAWVGDQLTVDRLRGLFRFRAEDENSFERLDFTVLVFGWFHLQMAFANSLHKQYEGTNQSRGLKQAFQLLEKKGLSKTLTKGLFHHDLEEALYEVAEAHVQEDWVVVGNVEKLADLHS
jgi:mRNA-degrading endonuclease YafQ of YafQ-DinJ toxin-antitoxin module